jgi:hypothetical protein
MGTRNSHPTFTYQFHHRINENVRGSNAYSIRFHIGEKHRCGIMIAGKGRGGQQERPI